MEQRKITGLDSSALRSRLRAPSRSEDHVYGAVSRQATSRRMSPIEATTSQHETTSIGQKFPSQPQKVMTYEVTVREPQQAYYPQETPTFQELPAQQYEPDTQADEEEASESEAEGEDGTKRSWRINPFSKIHDADEPHNKSGRSVFMRTHYTINGRRRPWRDRARQAMLPAMAALLFLLGLGVSTSAVLTNHHVAQQVKAESSNSDGVSSDGSEKPDETEPDKNSVASYNVAPDMPRYVRINNLNVFARIRRMGIDTHNAVKAPGNIFDVGWYDNSSKPSDAGGAVFLDGHISGPTKHGVFYDIKKLQKGDKVEVETGDGAKYTYSVVGQEVFDANKVDMSKALVSKVPGKQGLNMMSCFGKYDSKKGLYSQRIMVYAVKDK